jgi:hypothetical protein
MALAYALAPGADPTKRPPLPGEEDPYAGMPAHSETESTVGPSSSSDTTSTQISAGHREAAVDQAVALNEQRMAQEKLNKNAAQQADLDAAAAKEQEEEQQRHIEARQKQLDIDNAKKAEKQAAAEKRRAQLEKDAAGKATTYWADKSAAAQIFSHIIVGMSEMSNVRAGAAYGQSPMQKELDKAFAEDARIKTAKFENSKMFSELADKDVDKAEEAKAKNQEELLNTHLVMVDGLIKKAKSYTAAIGTDKAKAAGAQKLGELDAKKAEIAAKLEALQDKQVKKHWESGSTTSKITDNTKDDKGKGAQVIKRARGSNKVADLVDDELGRRVYTKYQKVLDNQRKYEPVTSAPYIGGLAGPVIQGMQAIDRGVGKALTGGWYDEPAFKTNTAEALRKYFTDPVERERAAEIHAATLAERQAIAADNNPNMITNKDIEQAGEQTGDQSMDARQFAAAARERAAERLRTAGITKGDGDAPRGGVVTQRREAARDDLVRVTDGSHSSKDIRDAVSAAKRAGLPADFIKDRLAKGAGGRKKDD